MTMPIVGEFDHVTQSVVEPVKQLDLNHLRFERWLLENHRGESEVVSRPRGEYSVIDLMEIARGK